MTLDSIKRIGVVGAGQMGGGIAQVAAQVHILIAALFLNVSDTALALDPNRAEALRSREVLRERTGR